MRLYDFETHFEAEMALMHSDDDNNAYNLGSSPLFRYQSDNDDHPSEVTDNDENHAPNMDNSSSKADILSNSDLTAFRRYTQEIGQFALLDADQERSLAGQIADGFLAFQRTLARDHQGRTLLIDALLISAENSDEQTTLLRETKALYDQLRQNPSPDTAALARTEHVLIQCLDQHNVSRDLLWTLADRFLSRETDANDPALISSLRKTQRRILGARDRLIEGNLRLVIYIARRFKDRGVDSEDLIQEGNLGLMRAAIKFDASAGVRFSTYGFWWITQAMRQCITRNRSMIRYPNHVAEQVNRVARLTHQHHMAHGELPPAPQLAKAARISRKKLEDLLSLSNICVSLSRPLNEDGQMQLEDTLSDQTPWAQPLDQAWLSEQRALLDRLLGQLDRRDATIIRLKYGIGYRKDYSLREIADQLGISKERVRQIVDRSTQWLRSEHLSLQDSFGDSEDTLLPGKRAVEA